LSYKRGAQAAARESTVMKLVEASVALACAEGEQGVRAGVDVAVWERKEGSTPPKKGKMEILIKGNIKNK
jgi:hypothetical protein